MSTADVFLAGPTVQIWIGLLDPIVVGTGFDTLTFRVERGGNVLLSVSFDDPLEALAWFSNRTLDLGIDVGPSAALDLTLEGSSTDAGARFSTSFLVGTVVPEPGTGLLFGIGLLLLGVRSRVSRARARAG